MKLKMFGNDRLKFRTIRIECDFCNFFTKSDESFSMHIKKGILSKYERRTVLSRDIPNS